MHTHHLQGTDSPKPHGDTAPAPGRPRVAFATFGCRVNQMETDAMCERLGATAEIVDERADIVVISGCTVTSGAERKARQAIGRARRGHPGAVVIVIGCLGDAIERGLSDPVSADLVAGNAWKRQIALLIARAVDGRRDPLPCLGDTGPVDDAATTRRGHVRAFLKVQDGCRHACTFCRTTQVRGPSRSKPVAAAVAEARGLVDRGFSEIVLVGIDLAGYGHQGDGLAELVAAMGEVPRLERLRLGSINADGLGEEVLDALAALPMACPHFHLPLQSGDEEVLRRMARPHTVSSYRAAVAAARQRFPRSTFGADVIVGFPGEDEEAFRGTLEIVEEVGFVNVHVFRYSPRRGTPAAEWPREIPEVVKRQRAQSIERVVAQARRRELLARVGETVAVLIERQEAGVWRGYTRDYLHARVASCPQLPSGTIVRAAATAVRGGVLEAVYVDE